MYWQKEGRIFVPEKYLSQWMSSHATIPLAEHLVEDRYRVYFSPRDAKNRSQIGYFEIDIKNPSNILRLIK